MNKSLLVIGPGFLGKKIITQAQSLGYDVHVGSRSGEEEFADLSELDSLVRLQEKLDPDYVIHCAASGRSADRIASYQAIYLKGCENIVAAFPKAKKLFTSSTSVYGQTDGSTVNEQSETAPGSETGSILLAAEQVLLDGGGTVARLSGIYGEGRSYMLKRLFSGEAAIEGDGLRLLNHIHHSDAASACLFLLDQDAGIYNVSDSVCLNQKETYEKLCQTFGLAMPKRIEAGDAVPSKRGFSDKCVSNQKIRSLGWEPEYPCFAEAGEVIARSLNLIS